MKSIHGKDIKIFACNSNKKLAEDIAAAMGLPLGRCTVGAFADGEVVHFHRRIRPRLRCIRCPVHLRSRQ